MIKDLELLQKTLLDHTKKELLQHRKDGVIIHLDGTLMSLVNVQLYKQLSEPFKSKVIVCTFTSNRMYLKHITTALKELGVMYEVKDLQQDYDTLSKYTIAGDDFQLEVAFKKRFIDLMLNIEADRHNLLPVGNLCYSQWVLNFPHECYKNLAHLHPLSRLYYSELQEFARYLGIRDLLVDRKPSHYLYRNQLDEDILGFDYEHLEKFLRNPQIEGILDREIEKRIIPEDRVRFMAPPIQRPSNILG